MVENRQVRTQISYSRTKSSAALIKMCKYCIHFQQAPGHMKVNKLQRNKKKRITIRSTIFNRRLAKEAKLLTLQNTTFIATNLLSIWRHSKPGIVTDGTTDIQWLLQQTAINSMGADLQEWLLWHTTNHQMANVTYTAHRHTFPDLLFLTDFCNSSEELCIFSLHPIRLYPNLAILCSHISILHCLITVLPERGKRQHECRHTQYFPSWDRSKTDSERNIHCLVEWVRELAIVRSDKNCH